ncbi:MAG: hypothetical protein EOO03_04880, partial [Chitinophagaceae bacterium]
MVLNNVEQALFCNICGRPCVRHIHGRRYPSAFVDATYDTHATSWVKGLKKCAGYWLTAWDPVAQKERWRVPYPLRGSGGILATGGNLVFQGTVYGTLAAYRADTGAKVWDMPVQQVPIAAPISYMIDGVQYIAVNAG